MMISIINLGCITLALMKYKTYGLDIIDYRGLI